MASTVFIDFETRVVASWLNAANAHVYNEILSDIHPASAISFVPSGSLTATNVQSAIEEAATLGGGGGGGATTLDQLTDVSTAGATTGQVLKFNGLTWTPAFDVTSGGTGTDADTLDGFDGSYYLEYSNFSNTPTIPTLLSNLGDVNTAGASNGQVLKYSGGQWLPAADDAGGGVSGKLLASANSTNPAVSGTTTSATSYVLAASTSINKQSATSKLVIFYVFRTTRVTPGPGQATTSIGISVDGGATTEITSVKAAEAYDPSQFTGNLVSHSISYVHTGAGVGSTPIQLYVASDDSVSIQVQFDQVIVFEVEQ